jgi:oligosaccharide repeat unit polymerase
VRGNLRLPEHAAGGMEIHAPLLRCTGGRDSDGAVMKQPLQGIWWLHPAVPFGAAGVVIGLSAYVIPESTYRTYWRMPKFFDAQSLWVTLACCGLFLFATFLSSRFMSGLPRPAMQVQPADKFPLELMAKLFRVTFYLTVLGYSLWAGLAIQRGMTIQNALDVIAGEKGAMYDARFSYLQTVGGVTTLTQFGTVVMILGAIMGFRQGWGPVRSKLIVILLLALMRALLNSERFALIELIVPFLIACLALKYIGSSKITKRARLVISLAPLVGVATLVFFFTSFEYFRSWTNYYSGRNQSLWEFGAMRLLGYYVTSFNNGAFFLNRLEPLNAPYFSLHFLWTFPLFSPAVKRLFPNPLLDTSDKWFYFPFLDSEANLEFNNADGMLFPMMDFGIAGGLIYWFTAGLVCGVLYELYRQNRWPGLLLYPMIYLGLMEVPLALLWGDGRAFLPYLILISVPILFSIQQRCGMRPVIVPLPKGEVKAWTH